VPAVLAVLSYAVQLVLVPALILWAGYWIAEFLRSAAQPYRFLDGPMRFVQTVLPTVVGFLLGFLCRRSPAFVREPARWIWIVPTVLCLGLLGTAIFVNLDNVFLSLLGPSGYDYSGTGIVRVVFPLGGVFLYSFGAMSGDQYTNPLEDAEKDYEPPDLH
jgi:hypothetical protein